MPSFRVTVQVRDARPGVANDQVMVAAQEAVRAHAHLDDSRLELALGMPALRLRFTVAPAGDAEELAAAGGVAVAAVRGVHEVATMGRYWLERRSGNRWLACPMPRVAT